MFILSRIINSHLNVKNCFVTNIKTIKLIKLSHGKIKAKTLSRISATFAIIVVIWL